MNIQHLSYIEIQEKLKQNDVLLADIADALEVSRSHVSHIARGNAVSFRVAKAIALSLNLEVSQVFGDKYANQNSQGRKGRVKRKAQIKDAILNNKPVPTPSMA
ncbi:hypothetical protein CJF42_25545 [Pseudoalteromonas sp. NBT06-2]|uniref:helix-turn-helix domain-containing protein n=1 Tax=Pseudoalteromonas sp. NBT06-2 TaxID=2025950 RepID=UPI000BA57C35|nr:helix-turn-helix transcriptional regulator [Pseudoalteromonas sp. NBT06-2]PAJ71659.1 hypothetical protein CJF42_25545 [Pseudoalteromonas sp. NBT06-2]